MLFQVEVMVTLWIVDAMKDDEGYGKIWVNKFGILGAMAFTSFLIHRGRVFVNKVTYIVVSVATAFKNKKQRIKGQWICFLLQLTILAPWFFSVLFYTTFFDVALLPTFGFAFFTSGYLKPQRGWSAISPVQADLKDQVSDGHLFKAMQG